MGMHDASIDDITLQRLRQEHGYRGALIRPGDDDYDDARAV